MTDNVDDQGRVHGDHCPWRNPDLGCCCGVHLFDFTKAHHKPAKSPRHTWMDNAKRWTGATSTGIWEAFGYVGSYGGASLQACVTVLLFAAYAEEAWARGRGAQTVDGQPDYSHPSYDD